jgi:hypothetical protein
VYALLSCVLKIHVMVAQRKRFAWMNQNLEESSVSTVRVDYAIERIAPAAYSMVVITTASQEVHLAMRATVISAKVTFRPLLEKLEMSALALR